MMRVSKGVLGSRKMLKKANNLTIKQKNETITVQTEKLDCARAE